ncbi:MAG TPA: hypothetical protein VG737_17385, partial [Cyclobacteriaceae bacterium]|nr:hypothetical protein [Cyclobacteriaceae bacterium]
MGQAKVLDIQDSNLQATVIERFKTIVGPENVIADGAGKEDYGHDKTEDYFFMPDVVLKPRTPGEISQIL